ncbi:MAG: hypothetical protein K6B67_06600 [Lachnospiraceae bacterium]|nr:hypothetical protein [Lachnospiraceae bacterium]
MFGFNKYLLKHNPAPPHFKFFNSGFISGGGAFEPLGALALPFFLFSIPVCSHVAVLSLNFASGTATGTFTILISLLCGGAFEPLGALALPFFLFSIPVYSHVAVLSLNFSPGTATSTFTFIVSLPGGGAFEPLGALALPPASLQF